MYEKRKYNNINVDTHTQTVLKWLKIGPLRANKMLMFIQKLNIFGGVRKKRQEMPNTCNGLAPSLGLLC